MSVPVTSAPVISESTVTSSSGSNSTEVSKTPEDSPLYQDHLEERASDKLDHLALSLYQLPRARP
jgi:hypothetical protein